MSIKSIQVKDLDASPEIKRILVTGGSGQVGSAIKLLKNKTKYHFLFPSSNEFNITKSHKMSNYLDKKNIDTIAVKAIPNDGIGLAINDRLIRGASK